MTAQIPLNDTFDKDVEKTKRLSVSLIPIQTAIIPNTRLDDESYSFCLSAIKQNDTDEITLYEEYQNPILAFGFQKLTELLTSSTCDEDKVLKEAIFAFVLATGTGKTLLFLLKLLYGIKTGIVHNAIVTAPWLMLINQHLISLDSCIENLKNAGKLPNSFKLEVLNNSSGNKHLSSNDEVYEDRSDEEIQEIESIESYALQSLKNIQKSKGKRLKHIDFKTLSSYNVKQEVVKNAKTKAKCLLVFSCLKSAISLQKEFSKVHTKVFDLLINDEIHNWQSRNEASNKKKSLERLIALSKVVFNFTATLKDTKPFPCDDDLIGEKVANIQLAHVRGSYTHSDGVKWPARLKPFLHVFIAYVDGKKTMDAQTKSSLDSIPATPMQYAKNSIIPQCMNVAKQFVKGVKAITASLNVGLDQTMTGKTLLNNDICFTWKNNLNSVCSGINLMQMDAGTSQGDRDKITDYFSVVGSQEHALLMQHSIVREGVSYDKLNTAICLRNLDDVALAQFLGRTLRYDPDCDSAVLFFVVDVNDQDVAKRSVEVLTKLALLGISMEDISSLGIVIENAGPEDNPRPSVMIKNKMNAINGVRTDIEEQDLEDKAMKLAIEETKRALSNYTDEQNEMMKRKDARDFLKQFGIF
jgi:hypothetical protein